MLPALLNVPQVSHLLSRRHFPKLPNKPSTARLDWELLLQRKTISPLTVVSITYKHLPLAPFPFPPTICIAALLIRIHLSFAMSPINLEQRGSNNLYIGPNYLSKASLGSCIFKRSHLPIRWQKGIRHLHPRRSTLVSKEGFVRYPHTGEGGSGVTTILSLFLPGRSKPPPSLHPGCIALPIHSPFGLNLSACACLLFT